MPKQIKLFHQLWEVHVVEQSEIEQETGSVSKGDYYNGLCDPNKNRIFLNKVMTRTRAYHTFLHEVYHALAEITGNANREMSEEESADFVAFIYPEMERGLQDISEWLDDNFPN